MSQVKLTIAIPSLPERMRNNLQPLYAKILSQVNGRKDVEVLCIMDNRTMSIGKKRTKLFQIASGKYTCIIDDDDDIVPDFVSTLLAVIDTPEFDVDVISYNQRASINGKIWEVKCSLNHNKEHPFDQLAVDASGNSVPCCRPPWHWCAWKTDFAKTVPFGDSNCHEDAIFVAQACKLAKTEYRLDKVMCIYNESRTAFNSSLDINSIPKVVL